MKCSFLLLLLVACCWCKTLSQLPIDSSYAIESGNLVTKEDGIIPVTLQERFIDPLAQEVLRVQANLNTGAMGVIFAKNSAGRSLRWYVDDIGQNKLRVQLCIDSQQRSCFSAQTLSGFTQPVNIQVKAEKTSANAGTEETKESEINLKALGSSYLRFQITVSNNAALINNFAFISDQVDLVADSGSAEPVTLSQVFKLSDFPETGEWTLELEQRDNNAVSLSQVAVADTTNKDMEVLLWGSGCLSTDDYNGLYQSITGTSEVPKFDYFRPSGCSAADQGLKKDRWGTADTSSCTLTDNNDDSFQFSCTAKTGVTADTNPIPGWCFREVIGNFEFEIKVDAINSGSGYLGAFALSEVNAARLTHFGIWATRSTVQLRYKDGSAAQQRPLTGSNTGLPVRIKVERKGDDFSYYSKVESGDWVLEPSSPATAGTLQTVTMANMLDPVDLCILYVLTGDPPANTPATGDFSAPTITLLPDEPESAASN